MLCDFNLRRDVHTIASNWAKQVVVLLVVGVADSSTVLCTIDWQVLYC